MNDFLENLENTESTETEDSEVTFARMEKERKTLLNGQQMVFVKPEKYDGKEVRKAMIESDYINADYIEASERIDSFYTFDEKTGEPIKHSVKFQEPSEEIKEIVSLKKELSLSNFAVEDILRGSYREIFEEHTNRIQKYFEQRRFLSDHEIKQEIWELERILKDFRKEVSE